MRVRRGFRGAVFIGVLAVAALAGSQPASSAGNAGGAGKSDAAHGAPYWTAARRAAAVPRDLFLDQRGLAYRRGAGGGLTPYGHSTPAEPVRAVPTGKPAGGGGSSGTDTTPPTVTGTNPATGATVTTSSYAFKATVTDTSGLRSVAFVVRKGTAASRSYTATAGAGGVYSATVSGLTDGSWNWWVVAKDGAKRTNTRTTSPTSFTVAISTGGGGGTPLVTSAPWSSGGAVQNAAGRLYFEMPTNAAESTWGGYVCSGTVATDATTGRSIIITAAHCVYDDEHKVFARNVIFIPNQAGTTGTRTDLDCTNDPLGCWTPSFGVVDVNWTTRTFPANIPWDYAYYVVPDTGAHTAGLSGASTGDILDSAVTPLTPKFQAAATQTAYTHALGYSYSEDPKFMYCAQGLGTESSYQDLWLGSCGLSGGASGGPWVQPMDLSTGTGPIISVNSWGYTNQPGMAGAPLAGTSASCVFTKAIGTNFTYVTNRGVAAGC